MTQTPSAQSPRIGQFLPFGVHRSMSFLLIRAPGVLLALLLCLSSAALPVVQAATTATAAPTAPVTDDQGITPQSIRIGMSAAFHGASRNLGSELYRGAAAYFNDVNQRGGVHGRKIELIAYDDSYAPEKATKNTLQLMNNDKVFLLFNYVGTPTVTRVLPLLKKYQAQHYYLFFPFTGAEPQRQLPYSQLAFNLRASYKQETAGLVSHLVDQGHKRIAVLYQADAYGRSGWVGIRDALAARGLNIEIEATYKRGTRFSDSLDAQAAVIESAKPDAVICIGSYAASAAFIRDARRAGLTMPIANISFSSSLSTLSLLKKAGLEDGRDYTQGLVTSDVVPSTESTNLASVKQYRAVMDREHIMPPANLIDKEYVPFQYSDISLEGFLNAKLLVEILERLGDHPTRDAIAAVTRKIHDFDLGTGSPLSFVEDNQASDSVYYNTIKNGQLVPLSDWSGWLK